MKQPDRLLETMKKLKNRPLFSFRVTVMTILGIFVAALLLLNCRGKDEREQERGGANEVRQAEYVGRESCRECHEKEYELFRGSDHDLAMDPANPETVLGDFDDATFSHLGVTSRFYREGDRYLVYTEGEDGEMKEFEIDYTFGIRPLQQYLVKFPDGAYQCLPIAWDTRPEEEGGQRWFHLYGDERIEHDDILYWTRINQNWNYMCAECHSTNLRKNYTHETGTYHTEWSEIDVSCEACHGPGSLHNEWAYKVEQGASPDIDPTMGLVIRLKDTDNGTWIFHPDSTTAYRSVPRESDELVQMCSRCHARRGVMTEDYYHGGSLLDTHWPSLLDEGLYFPDGQIQDEVYVYGSFLQSKMYEAGVQCKDCHEPHSGQIYVEGNALCYRCHLASEYGARSHHFHDPAGEGASCYECHMHERNYMVIDPRRDHSIRVPRPDLSDKLGTPNACNQCHPDESTEWATQYLVEWYGEEITEREHYGEVFWAGRKAYPEALPKLIELGEDTAQAPMVRATAISLLGNYSDLRIPELFQKTVWDGDPLIRYASMSVIQNLDPQVIGELAPRLLNDSVKLVRILAANALAGVDQQYYPNNREEAFEAGLEEYRESLMINADHPTTHMNLGNLHLKMGDIASAEASYREAMEIEPGMVGPYINLADLYRRVEKEDEGEKVLKTALERYPDFAAVEYALGLLYVRNGEHDRAMGHLKKAAEQAPEEAHYSYVYGIGLNSQNEPDEAIAFLQSALERHPYDRDILYALATIHAENGMTGEARSYAKRLVKHYPQDQRYRQLMNYLDQQAASE